MLGTFEEEFDKRNSIIMFSCARNLIGFAYAVNSMRQQDIVPALGITYEHDRATLADIATNSQFSTTDFLAVSAVHEELSLVRVLVGVGEMTAIAVIELKIDEGRR